METRKHEDKTIVMQAQTVSSKSNVLYSRIPVFSSSLLEDFEKDF
jgi:hypothetical protein